MKSEFEITTTNAGKIFAKPRNTITISNRDAEHYSCPKCSEAMEQVDTTFSNVKTNRAEAGQHTGDIYFCEHCKQHYIDNLLTANVEAWSY